MEENTYDIKELFYIIRKRIILIIILTLAGVMVAVSFSYYVMKPMYSAKCNVIVGKDSSDKLTQSDVTMYQDLVKTYSEIAKSTTVAERAGDILNNKISTKELMSKVTVAPETGTQILDISYESPKAELAADVANAFAQAFIEKSQNLLSSGSTKILDKAEIPSMAAKPNKKLNIAIGFFLGLMVALGIVFSMEYLHSTITKEEDVDKYLGLPFLGAIPKNHRKNETSIIEAYKTVRTNLKFLLKNKEINTIMVCSSVANEGKTSVASNIGNVLQAMGKKVLLIDCDFRRPCLHRQFNISNGKGLRDILFEDLEVNEIINPITEDFHVITCGEIPYNPSEILDSKKMKEFIERMKTAYDYVILDTPPLIGFTDALTLVEDKVGVVLVVSSEESKIDLCNKSKRLLLNVNANIIGVVLNKVDKKISDNYDYNGYFDKNHKKKFKSKSKKTSKASNPSTLEV